MDDFASILITEMEDPESGDMRTLKPVGDIPTPDISHLDYDKNGEEEGFGDHLTHPDKK